MNNYYYGRGMNASRRPRPENEEPKEKPKKKKFKLPKFKIKFKKSKLPKSHQLIAAIALLIFLGLFTVWFFLGQFRFMFWKPMAFTGFPFGDRNYIVLFQNNYELRPTGGFISSYGVLKFNNGFYGGIEFKDVYGDVNNHDYVEPPLVLSTLLEGEGYEGHTFRDANYNPDFTLASQDIVNFYNLAFPDEDIDGVIAADFHFLEMMLSLYEPMDIDGYTLTQDNVFETLSAVVSDIDRHNEEALENRKGITGPLVKKVISKSLLPWRIDNVRDIVEQAFNEKHLMATFTRNRLEKQYAKRGWNGALPESNAGDFIAVNHANYGGMKSNRYLTQDVKYKLDISEEKDILGNPTVTATAIITLSHEGGWNTPLSGPYTGYLRTQIPLGSDLIQGSDIIEESDSALVIGELVDLLPGESKTYTYRYELPEYVWQNGEYRLHLHKQPGTDGDYYDVIVHAPDGMSLSSDSFDVRENVAFYDTKLLTDTNLNFELLGDNKGPRVVAHEITGFNEFMIVFNERLSATHAQDLLRYKIVDMDYSNPGTTDQLQITKIKVDGSAVFITTDGMSKQPQERYEITIQGIQDRHGNSITPSPRTLTVVQRDDIDAPEPEPEPEPTPEPAPEEELAPEPENSDTEPSETVTPTDG